MATNRFLYAQLSYDPVGDFAPVTMLITQPNMMCVPNTSPAKSVKEFIDFCNANKGKVTYASSGNGTTLHLSGELFKRLAKVEMTHIPYRGGAPAINDLIPGRVDVIFDNMPSIVSHVRSGSVRGLAVSTRDRVAIMPDMPTIAETVPGFDVFSWFGFFVPIKTSADVVAKINADTNAALVYPAVKVALRGSRRGAQGLDTSRARRLPAVGNRQVGPGDPRRADQAGKLRAEDDPCCWPSPTPQASWLASRSRAVEKALTSQMFGETE
jgi:tripartite-type tricarboxylate transporter receptor subunit TctC